MRSSACPLVKQAELLAAQYDAVVMNPPYMGGGGMSQGLYEGPFLRLPMHHACQMLATAQ